MKIKTRLALAVLLGFMLGTLWLIGIRFIMYKSDTVHYHANFALYINGQRDAFKSFTFYEEVQSCGSDEKNNPKNRVHMHDNVNHVAHVHEPGVTWGHFFANLGYTLGDSLIKTDNGAFLDAQNGNELTFILNDKTVNNIANEPIKSEDVLLVNYGKDSAQTLAQRYQNITQDAGAYNKRNDPSSCRGTKELTFSERLIRAIGLTN